MSDTKTEKQDSENQADAGATTPDAENKDAAAVQPTANGEVMANEAEGAGSPKEVPTSGAPPATGADSASAPANETDAAVREEPPPEPTPEERLATSQAATMAMKEKMLRVAADFENFRRRSQREVQDARKRGTQNAIKDLLPVFDNLERATAHVDDATDAQSMADGLRMVIKQLVDVLGKMGIERIDAVGQGFDPNLHESIQYEHSSEYEPGIVMNELQPGYKQGNSLIRPAMVMVSRGPAPEPEPGKTADDGGGGEAGEAEVEATDAASAPGADPVQADASAAEPATDESDAELSDKQSDAENPAAAVVAENGPGDD